MTVVLDDLTPIPMKKGRNSLFRGCRYVTSEGLLSAMTCTKCERLYDVSAYNKSTKSPYGVRTTCKKCQAAESKVHYTKTFENSPEVFRQRQAKQAKRLMNRSDDEVAQDRERLRPSGIKECRTCHKDLVLAMFYEDKWFHDALHSSCKSCENSSKWAKESGKIRRHWDTVGVRLECYIEGCEEGYDHADHVIPLALLGENSLDNILPLCAYHNISKNDRPLLWWLKDYLPDLTIPTISTVLSYGVSPWTYLDSPEEIGQILTELESVL